MFVSFQFEIQAHLLCLDYGWMENEGGGESCRLTSLRPSPHLPYHVPAESQKSQTSKSRCMYACVCHLQDFWVVMRSDLSQMWTSVLDMYIGKKDSWVMSKCYNFILFSFVCKKQIFLFVKKCLLFFCISARICVCVCAFAVSELSYFHFVQFCFGIFKDI